MDLAQRADQNQANRELRKLAGAQYERAQRLAEANGLELLRLSKVCWYLRRGRDDAAWELFPGVQKILTIRGPLLKVPARWLLLDAVRAAMEA